MRTYRPRCYAEITVPVFGASRQLAEQAKTSDTYTMPLEVHSARLTRNDHNHADELILKVESTDAWVDPRLMKDCVVTFFMGNADADGNWLFGQGEPRFVGIGVEAKRAGSDDGFATELTFRDYTDLFLRSKPYPSDGAPPYTSTLTQAWQLICDHTGYINSTTGKLQSTVEILRNSIEFRGVSDLPLSGALPSRLAKLARVQVKPNDTAWDVWSRCVGSLGLITFIENDTCVVTDATDLYTLERPPNMVWAKNILSVEETANLDVSDKGVAVTSFDPVAGSTVEAFWPPPGEIQKKILTARARSGGQHTSSTPAFPSDRYDFFEYPSVSDPTALLNIAKRAWEERSRQSLQGRLTTAEMVIEDDGGALFDLLTLKSGDALKVVIDPIDRKLLAESKSDQDVFQALIARGYSADAAALISKNRIGLSTLSSIYHVKAVTTTLESDRFEVEIHYYNRITVDGMATE